MSILNQLGTKIGTKLKELTALVGTKLDKTGNAASASYSTYNIAIDDRDVKPNTTGIGSGKKGIKAFFTSNGGMTGAVNTDYQDLLVLDTYSDLTGGLANALTFDKSAHKIQHWLAAQDATTWGAPKTLAYTTSTVANTNTLDGLDSTQFLRSDIETTANGIFNINGSATFDCVGNNFIFKKDTVDRISFEWQTAGVRKWSLYHQVDEDLDFVTTGGADLRKDGNLIYHAGNDGAGSGLDADKLDGLESTQFLKTNNSIATGNLTIHNEATNSTSLTLSNNTPDIFQGCGNLIEFKITDGNTTLVPQVKIGMEVRTISGLDEGIATEGDGNFVVYTSDATDALGGGTFTEKLRVTHKGQVTAPLQPYAAWSFNTDTVGTRSFTEIRDIGNNLASCPSVNGTVGRFTAPVTGVYMVTLRCRSNSTDSNMLICAYGSFNATNPMIVGQEVLDLRSKENINDGHGFSEMLFFDKGDYIEFDFYRASPYLDTGAVLTVTISLLH